MISFYTLNIPALIALLVLVGVGFFHLLIARRQEYKTLVFSSAVKLGKSGPLTIHNEGDVIVNCTLKVDVLTCRNLFVGPKGVIEAQVIQADRIVVEGNLRWVEQISAEIELINKRNIEIVNLETPKLILEKRSVSSIQIVPKETKVIQKPGAQVKGFFSSLEEVEMQQKKTSSIKRPVVASVHLLRRNPGQ